MTAVAFIHSEHKKYFDRARPYTCSVSSIHVYKVLDDSRFTLLTESTSVGKLEDVALKFNVIELMSAKELEGALVSLSQIWDWHGSKLGKDSLEE